MENDRKMDEMIDLLKQLRDNQNTQIKKQDEVLFIQRRAIKIQFFGIICLVLYFLYLFMVVF